MTSNKEDYLKVIYELGGETERVTNKEIAEKLDLAAPSVSEMLVRLQQEGLVEYKAYHGTKLTEQGLESCIKVVRSHRLWEVFLMEHLGYTWREAHEDAHLLEHIAPDRMIDRLDKYLGYPKTCPHGAPIPRHGILPEEQDDARPLSSLENGEEAVIVRIIEDGKLLDYLTSTGMQINEKIEILHKGQYEGPIIFKQCDKTITISYKAATQIYVR